MGQMLWDSVPGCDVSQRIHLLGFNVLTGILYHFRQNINICPEALRIISQKRNSEKRPATRKPPRYEPQQNHPAFSCQMAATLPLVNILSVPIMELLQNGLELVRNR